jgi:hypothetical protein
MRYMDVSCGAFMRDCRTKGEAPLHRAAAFGDAEAIQLLLDAGAVIDAQDARRHTAVVGELAPATPCQLADALLRQVLRAIPRIAPRRRAWAGSFSGGGAEGVNERRGARYRGRCGLLCTGA